MIYAERQEEKEKTGKQAKNGEQADMAIRKKIKAQD